MKALILAAGYATRMYPLTKTFPKPLLSVGGRPMIDYIIEKLERIPAITEIIVVTNSKFIGRFRSWHAKHPSTKRIRLVDDLTSTLEDRRGAIGDMYFAISRKRIKDDLLVIGGDNLFNGELHDFVGFCKKHAPAPVIGVYDIKRLSEASRYGVVKINARSKVVDFQEKPEKPHSTLVGMCLYYFPASRLGLLRRYFKGCKGKCDATGCYIDWLRKTVTVYAHTFCGTWFDIGDPQYYKKADKQFS